jgi:glycosyltransferase involved in cell wall biosynthesis
MGAAFIFWMQDFYSLAVQRFLGSRWGGLGRLVANHYRHLENAQLNASDAIVLISDDFLNDVARLVICKDLITIIPNWAPIDEIPIRTKQNRLALGLGLHNRFVFLYSGTLALKHDPNLLWALSLQFKDDPDVRIAVAATGVGAEALKARMRENPQKNLMLLPLQPMAQFPDLLGSADVMLAILEADSGTFSVPSKVHSYLCSGRPIVLSAPAENLATRTILSAGAGLCVNPGDVNGFLAAACRLRIDPSLAESLGKAGRKYAEANFDIKAICDRFEGIFIRALKAKRSGRTR